jgi:maltose alpha-D-glucosyltransferase/alpha-amylase
MVTPKEREWMWNAYAPEARMRLNLGIRRRLAPLLDNDIGKIELANSLLFTLPGSPIIYYGDEIGMGDDIWLKDRDGVRTPMQWSTAENAGFSLAPAQRLYVPLIQDPVYGYSTVNVESQREDPHSLLNVMKRQLATRNKHRVFARGDLHFLSPASTAVLAYVRRYQAEIALVVNNLANENESAEMDLAEFEGKVPTDMFTGQKLLPIGRTPYRLDLGAHRYYWLDLV